MNFHKSRFGGIGVGREEVERYFALIRPYYIIPIYSNVEIIDLIIL